jgi:hypothetical protein
MKAKTPIDMEWEAFAAMRTAIQNRNTAARLEIAYDPTTGEITHGWEATGGAKGKTLRTLGEEYVGKLSDIIVDWPEEACQFWADEFGLELDPTVEANAALRAAIETANIESEFALAWINAGGVDSPGVAELASLLEEDLAELN